MTPPEWKLVNTLGKGPGPRYQHSMHYMNQLSILVIFGGKSDSKSEMFYYNDISVLNLKTLSWFSVSMYGGIKDARSMHVSFVYRKKLVIFGGINENGYVSN
jgi:hypothetical protein